MARVTRRARSVRTLLLHDEILRTSGPGDIPPVPEGGWIRTVREARGLTQGDLGAALQIERSSVNKLEEREADGGATLNALIRAARALGCTLEYRLVPPGGQFANFLGAGPSAINATGGPTLSSTLGALSGTLGAAVTAQGAPASASAATTATSHQSSVTGTPPASTTSPEDSRNILYAAFKHAQEIARGSRALTNSVADGAIVEASENATRSEVQAIECGDVAKTSSRQAPVEAVRNESGDTVLPSAKPRRSPKLRESSTDTGQLDVFGG
jgi:transcriptional regulator with XRE-family HTH domain